MQIQTVPEPQSVLDKAAAASWTEGEPSAADADPELLDEFLSRLQAIILRSPARPERVGENRLPGRP